MARHSPLSSADSRDTESQGTESHTAEPRAAESGATADRQGSDASDEPRRSCPVCDTPRTGDYCPNCGHAYQDEPLTLRMLFRRGLSRVFDLDAGLLHTFLALFRHPGRVARDYADGIRKPYVNPFTYFLLGAALQLAVQYFTYDVMVEMNRQMLTQDPATNAMFTQLLGEEDMVARYTDLSVQALQQTYTWMAFLFFTIPLAIGLRIFLAGRTATLAQTGVLATYMTGHMLILTAPAAFLLVATGSLLVHQVTVFSTMLGWSGYAIVRYFGWSARTAVGGGISVVVSFLIFFISLVTTFYVFLLMEVGVEQFLEVFSQGPPA